MRKELVRCPICGESLAEGCALAASEKATDEEIHMYCCEALAKRDKEKQRS